MFKKVISLVLMLSFPVQSLAVCTKPVTLLEEGASAPCRGFLFTPEKEREVYLTNERYKLLEQELVIKDKFISRFKEDAELLEDIISKEREKAEMWRNTAVQSTTHLIEVKESQGKRDMLMVITGVALTVLAGWSIGQASK